MGTMKLLVNFSLLFALVYGDVYMHNPRGSNNRVNGRGRNRQNANRVFDSQNNNRGGYNAGPGKMYYYQDSEVKLEWTNQHSCGGPNNNCELIIQYMCDDRIRDGTSEGTIPDRINHDADQRFGRHESFASYINCKYRSRNHRLYTADQKLKSDTAQYTRQNPNGQRRGLECPEERDYYPYWHPTAWRDIAVFTNNPNRCNLYRTESQNVKSKWACEPTAEFRQMMDRHHQRHYRIPITKAECEKFEYPVNSKKYATWKEYPAHGAPAPDCLVSNFSRDNHLGNGIGGFPNTYMWKVPNNIAHEKCVLRMRYNISTNDFDGWNTFSNKPLPQKSPRFNCWWSCGRKGGACSACGTGGSCCRKNYARDPAECKQATIPCNGYHCCSYPPPAQTNTGPEVDLGKIVGLTNAEAVNLGYTFKNNPEVKPLNGNEKFKLRLAVNTAQFARTFQDRSHKFAIKARPANLVGKTIHNVNVRGKRGNIVQTYPAVEYDFVPDRLVAKKDDFIHFQWTGADTNPHNNAGEGPRGTDRSNVALLKDITFNNGVSLANTHGHWASSIPGQIRPGSLFGFSETDAVKLATISQTPYFDLGPRQATGVGTYNYMCTRNNNFSNRSQKGKIIIEDGAAGDQPSGQTIAFDNGDEVVYMNEAEFDDEIFNSLEDDITISERVRRDVTVVKKDPLKMKIERLNRQMAEKNVKAMGGDLPEEKLAADFLEISPVYLKHRKVTLRLKAPKTEEKVQRSVVSWNSETNEWNPVKDTKQKDGFVTFSTMKGGVFGFKDVIQKRESQ